MTTQGKMVCKRTTKALAEKVCAAYAAAGRNPEMFASGSGYQVIVRGRKIVKHGPAGVTNSFGGGVPLLKNLAPELAAEIESA